jgi:hypothetical protein
MNVVLEPVILHDPFFSYKGPWTRSFTRIQVISDEFKCRKRKRWRVATARKEEDRQREIKRRRAAAAQAARAADLRTSAARASEAARRSRAVAIKHEQEAA